MGTVKDRADCGSETLPACETGIEPRAFVLLLFLPRFRRINSARNEREFRALTCQAPDAGRPAHLFEEIQTLVFCRKRLCNVY